jgi:hypothetical protein
MDMKFHVFKEEVVIREKLFSISSLHVFKEEVVIREKLSSI